MGSGEGVAGASLRSNAAVDWSHVYLICQGLDARVVIVGVEIFCAVGAWFQILMVSRSLKWHPGYIVHIDVVQSVAVPHGHQRCFILSGWRANMRANL